MDNVIITGISGGIGRAVAEQLLITTNSSIVGIVRNINDDIQSFADKYHGRIDIRQFDLTEVEKIEELINSIVADHGPICSFVHCAGFDKVMPLHMTNARDIESLWKLHALVPMIIISYISKKKNHCDNANIVLITSQSAHEGAMGHTAYAAAKGAIEGYLAPAAAELMEKGIRLNEVCFAPIKTNMSASWINKVTDMQKLTESYPLGLGEVEDASNLICFLLSEKSKWINGQIITADGGHSVRKV